MKRVAICGMGIVTKAGMSAETIWEIIQNDKKVSNCKPDYSSLSAKKIRRMSEDAKMLVLSTANCIEDSQLKEEQYHDCGIMVNVAYGPLNTTLRFADFIGKDEPNMASPIDFANTVLNAVVGHTAQYFGMQGPSTLLMGSDILGYTTNYMNQRMDQEINIIVGGVEEESKDMSLYGEEKYGVPFNEDAAITLMLSNQLENQYANIKGFAESGLPNYYMKNDVEVAGDSIPKYFKKMIEAALEHAQVKASDIDAIFCASPTGKILSQFEDEAIQQVFDKEITKIHVKDYVGELVSASMLLTTGIAAYAVKKESYRNVLVLGYEQSETIEAFVIGRD